jgi:hypothetical protein
MSGLEAGRSPSVKRSKPVDSSLEEEPTTPEPTTLVSRLQITTLSKKRKVVSEKQTPLITDFFQDSCETETVTMAGEGSDVLREGRGSDREEECSNKDIMRVLVSMKTEFATVNGKLDSMNGIVEKLEGEIFVLKNENDKLREDITRLQKKDDQTQERLEEAVYCANVSREHADRNEQYSRRNNVKIMFVEEGSDETVEDTEKIALKIFKERLNLKDLKSGDIEVAHRLGKKKDGQKRPIIVKFVSRKSKNQVIKNRKLLKGKTPKIVIFEDLAKGTYQLYQQAASHYAVQDSWTSDGKVFVTDSGGKTHRLQKLSDLDKLPHPPLSVSTSSGHVSSTPKHKDDRQPPPRRKKTGRSPNQLR